MMPHKYTRQRQGRDFTMHEELLRALEEQRKTGETAQIAELDKKSLFTRLTKYKEEAERNAIPVDGHEPPEKRGLTK
jgi:hypothetical protein